MVSRSRPYAFVCALLWFGAGDGELAAAELRVLTSGTFAAAHRELSGRFEKQTGHVIVTGRAASIGPESIPAKLAAGERADVVILAIGSIDELIGRELVRRESRVELVRSTLGVAVKKGVSRPDLSTVDAVRRALLRAKSIAYSSSVSGSYFIEELLPRLGIADRVLPKCVVAARVSTLLLAGEVEMGIQQISELIGIEGIEDVVPLPAELQKVTIFGAAISVASTAPSLARDFIAFLASPAATDVVRKCGLEPVSPPAIK